MYSTDYQYCNINVWNNTLIYTIYSLSSQWIWTLILICVFIFNLPMAHFLGVVLWMAFGFSFVKQFGNLHSIFVIIFCFLYILYIPYLYELNINYIYFSIYIFILFQLFCHIYSGYFFLRPIAFVWRYEYNIVEIMNGGLKKSVWECSPKICS